MTTRKIYSVPNTMRLLIQAGINSIGKKVPSDPQLPEVVLTLDDQTIDRKHYESYLRLCGFSPNTQIVPSTYLQVLSQSLQMLLMLDKKFPFPMLGMIHIGNILRQLKPVKIHDRITFSARFGGFATHEKGRVFKILCQAQVLGELVWECECWILIRGKSAEAAPFSIEPSAIVNDGQQRFEWRLSNDIGFRYAGVSGDYNPIHLYPWSAKLFGFKRHIAHGLFNLGKSLAYIIPQLGERPYQLDTVFKLPAFLPHEVVLRVDQTTNGLNFDLVAKDDQRPHLISEVRYLAA